MALHVHYYKDNVVNYSELPLVRHIWQTYDERDFPGNYVLIPGASFCSEYVDKHGKTIKNEVAVDAVLLTPRCWIFIELKRLDGPYQVKEIGNNDAVVKILDNGEWKERLEGDELNYDFSQGVKKLRRYLEEANHRGGGEKFHQP